MIKSLITLETKQQTSTANHFIKHTSCHNNVIVCWDSVKECCTPEKAPCKAVFVFDPTIGRRETLHTFSPDS